MLRIPASQNDANQYPDQKDHGRRDNGKDRNRKPDHASSDAIWSDGSSNNRYG